MPAVLAAQDEADTSMEICAACHDEVVTAFVEGDHGRAMARLGEDVLSRSCNTCHGPAETHLEELTPESINRWPEPEACATCHPASLGTLRLHTPDHPRQGVLCLDCHASGHGADLDGDEVTEPLLLAQPVELCGDCHRETRSRFNMPFAHRDGREPMGCDECHAVHGTGKTGRLTLLQNGERCIACHTDKAGPFIFPHAPREVDGCLTCHDPHGSTNPRQLVRRTVANLCLECHADVPARSFHDVTQARFRQCQTCHRAVHGSNSDPRLFDE